MTDATPALAARDLAVRLGDLRVLDGVSLSLDSGELVGLVGPNGAGKTTLLRALAGYLTPDSGTVTVGGDDVHALPSRAASRRVAAVPQDTHLAFDFTVRDVVAMGRHPHRGRFGAATNDDTDAVTAALDAAALTDLADRSVTAVSGGERKRVLLARALAQDTPVLLLDEPTAGLDVNHQVRTLDIVRDTVDAGRAAVAAIHDLDLAARYCDRLLVLSSGTILADGPPDEVLTREIVGEAFDARAAVGDDPVTGTPTVTPLSPSTDGDASVHVLGQDAAARRLLAALCDAGFDVTLGPVAEGSVAAEAARRLDVPAVTAPPFEALPERALDDARHFVERAALTVAAAGACPPGRDALRVDTVEVESDADPASTVRDTLRERERVEAD